MRADVAAWLILASAAHDFDMAGHQQFLATIVDAAAIGRSIDWRLAWRELREARLRESRRLVGWIMHQRLRTQLIPRLSLPVHGGQCEVLYFVVRLMSADRLHRYDRSNKGIWQPYGQNQQHQQDDGDHYLVKLPIHKRSEPTELRCAFLVTSKIALHFRNIRSLRHHDELAKIASSALTTGAWRHPVRMLLHQGVGVMHSHREPGAQHDG